MSQPMHRIHQHGDALGVDPGGDAVAEVEHMPGMRAEGLQQGGHLAPKPKPQGQVALF